MSERKGTVLSSVVNDEVSKQSDKVYKELSALISESDLDIVRVRSGASFINKALSVLSSDKLSDYMASNMTDTDMQARGSLLSRNSSFITEDMRLQKEITNTLRTEVYQQAKHPKFDMKTSIKGDSLALAIDDTSLKPVKERAPQPFDCGWTELKSDVPFITERVPTCMLELVQSPDKLQQCLKKCSLDNMDDSEQRDANSTSFNSRSQYVDLTRFNKTKKFLEFRRGQRQEKVKGKQKRVQVNLTKDRPIDEALGFLPPASLLNSPEKMNVLYPENVVEKEEPKKTKTNVQNKQRIETKLNKDITALLRVEGITFSDIANEHISSKNPLLAPIEMHALNENQLNAKKSMSDGNTTSFLSPRSQKGLNLNLASKEHKVTVSLKDLAEQQLSVCKRVLYRPQIMLPKHIKTSNDEALQKLNEIKAKSEEDAALERLKLVESIDKCASPDESTFAKFVALHKGIEDTSLSIIYDREPSTLVLPTTSMSGDTQIQRSVSVQDVHMSAKKCRPREKVKTVQEKQKDKQQSPMTYDDIIAAVTPRTYFTTQQKIKRRVFKLIEENPNNSANVEKYIEKQRKRTFGSNIKSEMEPRDEEVDDFTGLCANPYNSPDQEMPQNQSSKTNEEESTEEKDDNERVLEYTCKRNNADRYSRGTQRVMRDGIKARLLSDAAIQDNIKYKTLDGLFKTV